jgi:hypothetical protein
MVRLSNRKRHLASIAQAGGMAPKRPKLMSIPMGEDQAFWSEYENDSDSQLVVDESGDSDVLSNSDDDEVLISLIPKG